MPRSGIGCRRFEPRLGRRCGSIAHQKNHPCSSVPIRGQNRTESGIVASVCSGSHRARSCRRSAPRHRSQAVDANGRISHEIRYGSPFDVRIPLRSVDFDSDSDFGFAIQFTTHQSPKSSASIRVHPWPKSNGIRDCHLSFFRFASRPFVSLLRSSAHISAFQFPISPFQFPLSSLTLPS